MKKARFAHRLAVHKGITIFPFLFAPVARSCRPLYVTITITTRSVTIRCHIMKHIVRQKSACRVDCIVVPIIMFGNIMVIDWHW